MRVLGDLPEVVFVGFDFQFAGAMVFRLGLRGD
jgi:hypothetical protein